MDVIQNTQVFATATENMAFDVHLLELTQKDQKDRLRIYPWPQLSITVPLRSQVPEPLRHIDHAQRPSGGGLLVHFPQDLVWSYTTLLHPPKSVLKKCSTWIIESAKSHQLPLTDSPIYTQNIEFCHTYINPYESWILDHKFSGMAIRRFKESLLIQGIVHLNTQEATQAWKRQLPEAYHPFISQGLLAPISGNAFQSTLFQTWNFV
jgi:lipoate-protein ligase A